jgi:hypothetical protein
MLLYIQAPLCGARAQIVTALASCRCSGLSEHWHDGACTAPYRTCCMGSCFQLGHSGGLERSRRGYLKCQVPFPDVSSANIRHFARTT